MAEKEVKLRKDGLPKQPLTVFEKIVITISVILVIATAVCGVMKYGFNKLEGVSTLITSSLLNKNEEKKEIDKKWLKLANRLLPDAIELKSGDGIPFDVRLEANEDFSNKDAEKIFDYLNILTVYDSSGNAIGNEETLKVSSSNITGAQLKIMALMKIADKLSKIKTVVNNVLIALIMLDVIAAIFITYFIWRRADDRRELRENAQREREIQKVIGVFEDEAKATKKSKKKKKKK